MFPYRRPLTRRRFLFTAGALGAAALVPLAACTSGDSDTDGNGKDGGTESGDRDSPPIAETADNVRTSVLPTDLDGLLTSAALFTSSEAVVGVLPDDDLEQACDLAMEHGIPVLVMTDDNTDAVEAEIERLGAEHVISVGDDWPRDVDHGRRGDLAGVALAAPGTGRPARATAEAAGLRTLFVRAADPRATDDSLDAVAAAAEDDQPVLALGDAFGTDDDLQRRLALAASVGTRLAGGGGVMFPGRHLVALYGHPSGPDLGVLGEQEPAAAVQRAEDLVALYRPLSDVPVVPTFEIITTVASSEPGPSGTYSSRALVEEIRPWVDAVVDAGGYAVLDLQPGRESLLDQATSYADLLMNPQVGLALDPEWKLTPDALPMQDIGTVTAAEVNEVVDWLDGLVAEHDLPQKLLMVHQFQVRMISERETMSTGTDHVSVAIHCDGHGDPGTKLETWDVIRAGLSPQVALGWKNFYDEDTPMFTPEQTFGLQPVPDIVTYQ